jgi:CPA2 family monovalent cation:H+ antiporter-2
MQIPIIFDLLIVYALAIGVIFVCHRLGIPPIVGFILTGVLAGPHVLGLIKVIHEVEILAEIGVILLLFTIGIEFSSGLAHRPPPGRIRIHRLFDLFKQHRHRP